MAFHETREIKKETWLPFFNSISSGLKGKAVDITMSSMGVNTHQSTLWQLHGLTYDPYDDALIVSCRQQEHVIASPTAILVEQAGLSVNSVEVTTTPGEREIIRFIEPVLLPNA